MKLMFNNKTYLIIIWIVSIHLIVHASFAQVTLTPFASGFTWITDIKNAGDERLFIVEKIGRIKIADKNGIVNPVPFLDIQSEIYAADERGLLGLAFSLDYKNDRRFYVNYTDLIGNTHIVRFNVSDTNPDMADPLSEELLLYILQPYSNHNGGCLQFGNDGYLYCAMGDGGAGGDPENRAQNLSDTLGKILRIDVSTPTGFTVPDNNPFINDSNAIDIIWTYGLRNPWRISFDRLTHQLWTADVGQGTWEEINLQPALSSGGENYGWRCYEGNAAYNIAGCGPASDHVFPVYQYPHSGLNSGCSVTGGYVYRGGKYDAMFGKYFFTDYCSDDIYSLIQNDTTWTATLENSFIGAPGLSTFGEDMYGELYVGGHNNGIVYKIRSLDCTPVAFITFDDTIKACNGEAVLSALYSPGLNYQWKRDGRELPGAISYIYTASLSGNYSVVVSNDSCTNESNIVYLDNCIRINSNVVIAPNPVSGEIVLFIKSYKDEMATVEIYDMEGRLCLKKNIDLHVPYTETYKISVPSLSSGLYLVKVKAIEFSYEGKIIITQPN